MIKQQFILNRINETKDYFVAEISKYIAFFHYFYKLLIALSVTTGTISISTFATVIWAPVGIASTSFSLAFSISTRIVKKMLKATLTKK